MKLIIDINEHYYENLKRAYKSGSDITVFEQSILNGTPYEEELPSYNLPSFDKLSRLGAGLPE